ncbi:MAG: AMP-binding protein [Taibaiella sp.]|nr:AMP-binding protein [Taibaiella sp.]
MPGYVQKAKNNKAVVVTGGRAGIAFATKTMAVVEYLQTEKAKMTASLSKIYRSGLLSPVGISRLVGSFMRSGVNLMALMRYTATRYPARVAVTDDNGSITYGELYNGTQQLVHALQADYVLAPGRRVAIACRNHRALVSAVFAASATGADIYMLSPDMNSAQLSKLCTKYNFHLFIHDEDIAAKLPADDATTLLPAYAANVDSVSSLCQRRGSIKRRYAQAGNLVVLTGGTTGEHKTAPRRQGVARYVSPLMALISQANIGSRRTVFIGTPLCHGFGLAGLFVAVLMGSEMCMMERFDARLACVLIGTRKADAAVLVPIMLQRMLAADASGLSTLKTVISGGAQLSETLARETLSLLGPVLYNLYGTSEAGFSLMATPADVLLYPGTIGRPIAGVEAHIADENGNTMPPGETGQLYLRNGWAINHAAGKWVPTGDLALCNKEGYYILQGRTDDMIVSGGVNVYPAVVEDALLQHPAVRECAVVGVEDSEFGQRLVAFVVLKRAFGVTELVQWLKQRVARYELPREIRLVTELPYTAVGKPDKRALHAMS